MTPQQIDLVQNSFEKVVSIATHISVSQFFTQPVEDKMPNKSKVAVITGASMGIGRSMAEKFLADGYQLSIFARTKNGLDEIQALAPDKVLVVTGDVTVEKDLIRFVEQTTARFGQVDVVIPNAGAAKVISFAESTPQR